MEQAPLFDRLGGRDGVFQLIEKVVANHLASPVVGRRFQHSSHSEEELVKGAGEFFCTGLSGVPTYEGAPLAEVHTGMNINEEEFVAVIDDIVAALDAGGVAEREQGEVLRILWGMKEDVVRL